MNQIKKPFCLKYRKVLFISKKLPFAVCKNGIVIHILHHTVSRSNFYWLLKLGSSSGSASPLILPSQFPSDIFKTRSTLQLRDSTGFTPVSLLSIATPNFIYIYLFHRLYLSITILHYK